MLRTWSQRRGQATAWLAAVLALLCVVAWLADEPQGDEIILSDAHVEASLEGGQGETRDGQVPMVITIRWGNMNLRALDSDPSKSKSAVHWDGYLAVDCGSIESAEPLGFESANPGETQLTANTDSLGPVVQGDGDRRVSWRSRVLQGWDGLRAHIRACTPSPDGRQQRSNLLIYTAQRTYRARLDWSGNDFVSLKTPGSDHRLEVHIDAKLDRRALKGARITAAQRPQRELAQLASPGSTSH